MPTYDSQLAAALAEIERDQATTTDTQADDYEGDQYSYLRDPYYQSDEYKQKSESIAADMREIRKGK